MTAWASIRRLLAAGTLAFAAFAIPLPASGAPEPRPVRPSKPTPTQLRELAEKAEKTGDWEAAFNNYCLLFVADRSALDVREKLNTALRHTQQLRRHRDPAFQQFVTGMPLDGGLDLLAEVFQKLPGMYADRDKATAQNLWAHAIRELDRAFGSPAFKQAFLDNPRSDKVDQFRAQLREHWARRPIADHKEARSGMRRLIAVAQDHFTLKAPAALAVEAASGACSGLDEYTVFLTPATGTEANAVPDLAAAGLYLGAIHDAVVIEGVTPNSWFALTYPHVRRGDRVVRANNRTIDPVTLPAVAGALRAPIEGAHHLDLRGAEDDAKIQVRIPVTIPSVYGTRMLPDKPVGYTRIGHFQASTPRDLDEALNALKTAGARAAVIDLRGNHGGSFLAAVETARRLLPTGLIVTTQGQVGEVANRAFSSVTGMAAHDVPIVLLIDAETASAAEVLAAALKDNNRATLVGVPSFGKGSVQYPLRLVTLDDVEPGSGKSGKAPKAGTVRVTIARLIAPTSGPITGTGVGPHLVEADPVLQLELAAEKAEELGHMPPGTPLPSPGAPMSP
ncbi:Tail-specific protease precursor [Gemmata obscuriglobus]|nr:S41 family peptidase [Gemmata obscuriglobus]QEG28862.1 Tail-specific protease precursor [Gemmata obscuriglobus]VTS07295.1 carboxyl-terminal protease : Carboxyl-terminal processing protease OS=Blastopirellula marina DSM 3645 GN=DSM3645_13203 PE=3 SV=1: Peptidase_S41 [Gemmata obscuriglobus UQM 2246]